MNPDASLAGTIITTLLDDAEEANEMEDFSLVAGDIMQTLADNPDALIELLVAAGEEGVAKVLGARPKYDPKDHFMAGAYAEWGRLCNVLSGKVKRGGPEFEVKVERIEVTDLDGDDGPLTMEEHTLVELLGRCADYYARQVCSTGRSREHDINEFCAHIHDLQARVLMQAAARSYPDRYRLAGGSLKVEKPEEAEDAGDA